MIAFALFKQPLKQKKASFIFKNILNFLIDLDLKYLTKVLL